MTPNLATLVAKFPPPKKKFIYKIKFDCKSSQIQLSFFSEKSNVDSVDKSYHLCSVFAAFLGVRSS